MIYTLYLYLYFLVKVNFITDIDDSCTNPYYLLFFTLFSMKLKSCYSRFDGFDLTIQWRILLDKNLTSGIVAELRAFTSVLLKFL